MQWINVENLFTTTKADINILIFIDYFPNVIAFAKLVKQFFTHWNEIIIVKNRFELSCYLLKKQPDSVFIDSDYGLKGYLQTLFFIGDVFVYDEGLGTYYVNSTTQNDSELKKVIFKVLGIGGFVGGHYKTKGVYVYNTLYYQSQYPKYKGWVTPFQTDYLSFFQSQIDNLLIVMGVKDWDILKIIDKKIAIYATHHHINNEISEYLYQNEHNFDFVFIKPHPHLIRFSHNLNLDSKFPLITENIMLEALLIKLSINNTVTVLHESSTGCLYLPESESLHFINFGGFYYKAFIDFKKHFDSRTF